MNISFGEFDSIMDVVEMLMDSFSDIGVFLTYSVNDILDYVNIPISIPNWIGGDLTPLALMIGVGLPMYLAYQFLTWLLNIIT